MVPTHWTEYRISYWENSKEIREEHLFLDNLQFSWNNDENTRQLSTLLLELSTQPTGGIILLLVVLQFPESTSPFQKI